MLLCADSGSSVDGGGGGGGGSSSNGISLVRRRFADVVDVVGAVSGGCESILTLRSCAGRTVSKRGCVAALKIDAASSDGAFRIGDDETRDIATDDLVNGV